MPTAICVPSVSPTGTKVNLEGLLTFEMRHRVAWYKFTDVSEDPMKRYWSQRQKGIS